ncbi:MAG: helix-turn-helix transcriptional regulator [Firmicutes bacterium]|nr:helix-turn-helix transcriptional regulator [[Eubacterium] siraeum]MCM1488978.1 helix-turn-helix transcriptional regulator [Bacillota bacterium]
MTYYENLRVIREDRGYTQKQIAQVLGTTQQYYSDYENGKRDIPIRIYIALSKFYKVSIDYLAGQTDEYGRSAGSSVKRGVMAAERKTFIS